LVEGAIVEAGMRGESLMQLWQGQEKIEVGFPFKGEKGKKGMNYSLM